MEYEKIRNHLQKTYLMKSNRKKYTRIEGEGSYTRQCSEPMTAKANISEVEV